MEPLEVVSAPLTVWLAPVGTAFPAIDVAPAGDWLRLGTNGDKNYDDDGVTVTHEQTIESWRGAGSVGPVKAWRTEEELSIGFTLVDISPVQYAKVLNDATVTETAADATAGTPGTAEFGLSQGAEIATFALLARGKSPVNETMNAQYQVKRCYQSENPEPTFTKGEPAGLEIAFAALEDLTAGVGERERFGTLLIGTAP